MSTWQHKGNRVEMPADTNVRLLNGSKLLCRTDILFDHFTYATGALGSAVPKTWTATQAGSGTLHVGNTTAGTYVVGISGATTDNAVELAGTKVGWNPSTRGGLVLEVRAKFVAATTATDGDFFIGFGDAATQASSLAYVVDATSAVTTGAPTEAVGFYYSSIPTSGSLFLTGGNHIGMISSKAGTDTATAPTTSVVKDSNFHIYRIEMDSSANCLFFIDDVQVGYVGAAITANTEMTPYIAAVCKNSHAHTNSVDYVFCAGQYV